MASLPALAQTTEAAGGAVPQRVVVTGSLISRADTETPTPVQVLTAQDIQRSGKTSVAELLNDLAANGAGTLGTGFSGAFANGASGVSLRGLTVGSTLVLIDGHRMSPYAIGDDSQRSFVDVSNIPFDAIDSIEILKSGASSLYGSDAVAGVVNIKLKKNFTGTRLTAEGGDTQHGGGATHRASLSTGIGDLDKDGYNAFVTAEWRHQGAIKVADRDQFAWDNRDWRSRGGNNLTLGVPTSLNGNLVAASSPFLYNPSGTGGANNAANFQFLDPSCNYTLYRAGGCAVRDTTGFIQPESENLNVLLGMTKKLSNNWELAFKGSMFKRDSVNNRGVPPTYSPTTYAGATTLNNGVLVTNVGRVPSTLFAPGAAVGANLTNTFANNARLYGYIPGLDGASQQDNTSTSTRLALDLTGSAYGWDVNVAGGLTKVKVDIDYSGYVDRAALYRLINSGQWNVLGNNSPALIAQVSPRFSNSLESRLNYFDAVGSRELMQLGAGPLALAAGVHWHKRTWDAPASSLTANGQVGNTSAFVIGSETNTAAFAELQATPIKNVELHLSSRYDHYDTYGNSFTPAASFKWTPVQQFALRGTFARGFRAPNPAETGNAGSFFQYNAINDPILCPTGNQYAAGTPVNGACGINPAYVQTTSQNLSPEKSKSYTLGFVVEPVRGLNATLDYYRIQVNNQIVTAAGNDPNYVPTFVRNPVSPTDIATGVGQNTVVGNPSVGLISYAQSPYINAGSTKTSGIEADVNYRWRLPSDMGVVRAGLSAAHTFSYEQNVAGVVYQLAGTQGPSIVSGATGSPKNRAQFSLGYAQGPLDVNATVNYTSRFSTLDPSVGGDSCASSALDVGGRTYFQGLTQPDYYCHVASFTSTNLNVQYKLSQNLTLKGSILNLFDKQPPFDVGTYGNASAQTSYNASLHQAGAVGRFYSLGLSYMF
ncbi:TonB-dependent receptor domain-containing protein [Massilia forsythiae]|uniref:TonB-dependent receptor domain-containing protein n=1 Tax=Massilia forsythiae TaxID=2728020 RepID=UPI001E3F3FBC|nr:TonB-dependent receptor [Massilia forsythiae]